MKSNLRFPLIIVGGVLILAGCSTEGDSRPVPGTLESTDSKKSENNTPRVNPTPNPEPESQPADAPR